MVASRVSKTFDETCLANVMGGAWRRVLRDSFSGANLAGLGLGPGFLDSDLEGVKGLLMFPPKVLVGWKIED